MRIENMEIRYPIGIQTFSEIIKGGYVYVDKTGYISDLTSHGKFIFLSRPRRFGKSLLVSTLKSYFEGERELFTGLDIEARTEEWAGSPVFHFDFNTGSYLEMDGLQKRLDQTLQRYERMYGLKSDDASVSALPLRFENLIYAAYHSTGRQVVVLVDEYDKPLLGLSDNPEIFEKNQRLLKNFYSNLKSMDEYIRFGFLTGVARFSKVSIFSDLNNLKDISLDDRFADICGITYSELEEYLHAGVQALALKRNESYEQTVGMLKDYYDGYLFTGNGSRLFNPFSLLLALDMKSIDPYWFETGTPSFLTRMIREGAIDPRDINGRLCSREELMRVRLKSSNPIPLMFQTGYLTIDHFDEDLQEYVLRFPNREVEIGFAKDLLPRYLGRIENLNEAFSISSFRRDLINGEPAKFMERLSTLFKALPYEDQNEGVYRAVTYLLCKLCSMTSMAESHSYKGRSDIEVLTRNYIYIFEFKFNGSVEDAMAQIKDRDYAGRYSLDSRRIFLIGANYTATKDARGLTYEIKEPEKW